MLKTIFIGIGIVLALVLLSVIHYNNIRYNNGRKALASIAAWVRSRTFNWLKI
jgi:hypothetical protein